MIYRANAKTAHTSRLNLKKMHLPDFSDKLWAKRKPLNKDLQTKLPQSLISQGSRLFFIHYQWYGSPQLILNKATNGPHHQTN